jgi:hypothetical protein
MEFFPATIMRSKMTAIMVASAFALLSLKIPLVSVVSSATVALVTLRLGAIEGLYILGCSCLASILLGFFLLGDYQVPLFYSLILWTPVWLISVILREGRHLFLAIEIAIIIASITVAAAYLYEPNLAEFWQAVFNPLLEPALVNSYPEIPAKTIRHFLDISYHLMTGLIAQSYVAGLLAGLFLGRWWQAILYNPGGFKKEYLSLRGQQSLAIATLVIFAAAWFLTGLIAEISRNVSILLFVLYAFIGTIILHCAFSNLKQKGFMIPFLYITMMFIPYALIPAAIIGLTDTWLNLRSKIPNQTSV